MTKTIGIIGRGIAGLSLAFRLRQFGHTMILLGESHGDGVASRAAQGLSNSKGLWVADQALLRLKFQGHRALKPWLAEVERVSGRRIAQSHAIFEPYVDQASFQRIAQRVYHGYCQGLFQVRNRPWPELRQAFPALSLSSQSFLGAYHYPTDLWFDVDATLDALEEVLRREGHHLRQEAIVDVLPAPDGRFRLVSAAGSCVEVDELVVAAGHGSVALLQKIGFAKNDFRMVLGATADGELAEAHDPLALIHTDKSFILGQGRFRIGAVSAERDVVDSAAWGETASRQLASLWHNMVGKQAGPMQLRLGWRLRTRDRLPLADCVRLPQYERAIYVMTAFYKNGLQLAPLAAERVADLLVNKKPQAQYQAFACHP